MPHLPLSERLPAARGELERARDPRPASQLRRREGDPQVSLGLREEDVTFLYVCCHCC